MCKYFKIAVLKFLLQNDSENWLSLASLVSQLITVTDSSRNSFEANLSAEVALVVLDMLELFCTHFKVNIFSLRFFWGFEKGGELRRKHVFLLSF